MDNGFFAYLQQLELMAFFSGYPLMYAVTHVLAGKPSLKNDLKSKIVRLLPISYALTGTLFLGLQLRNLYPDYSLENINSSVQLPWLMGWGLLSILFWLPLLSRRPVLSLLHSLVIFFFLVKDLFLHAFKSSADKYALRNDMRIYTDSLFLNLGAMILVILIYAAVIRYRRRKGTVRN